MPKSNIIVFSGIDEVSIDEAVTRWTHHFAEKYGEYNITPIDGSDSTTDWKGLEAEVVSGGLFAEHRLFLLRNYAIKLRKSSETGEGREESSEQKESSLLRIIETISDENFLMIISPEIPKTKRLSKALSAQATQKEYNDQMNRENWDRRFPSLPSRLIGEVLNLYKSRENPKEPRKLSREIRTSLEHLDLLGESRSRFPIEKSITIEKEQVIFALVDAILAGKIGESRKILETLLLTENIFSLMNSLISNIRNSLYIQKLKTRKTAREISELLSIHPFVVEKTLRSRISYREMADFFHHLVSSSIAQKSGKGMQKGELGLIFAIELGFLSLQKTKKS